MAEHPRPWTVKVDRNAELPIYTVIDAARGTVFTGTDEDDANAIAAAHEMLTALQDARMYGGGWPESTRNAVDHAIEKGNGAP